MIPLILAFQAAPTLSQTDQRLQACIALAATNPQAAEAEAEKLRVAGGGTRARQCLGMAYTQESRWREAAMTFETAAKEAAAAKDSTAARYWAQSGNAWLAEGDPAKAIAALTTAVDTSILPADRGEALLDRARAQVALGQNAAARSDLDAALDADARNEVAWLLSATLARRMEDLPRAKGDIAQALKLAPEDASVQLEAGYIAVVSRDFTAARTAWQAAVKLAPGTPVGDKARAALKELEPVFVTSPPAPAPATPPAPTTPSDK